LEQSYAACEYNFCPRCAGRFEERVADEYCDPAEWLMGKRRGR
jgi:hypothetical protein